MSSTGDHRPVSDRREPNVFIVGSLVFIISVLPLAPVLDLLPRNPDNSVPAGVLTALFAVLLVVACVVLRRASYRPLRFAAWWWAGMSTFIVVCGGFYLLVKAMQ